MLILMLWVFVGVPLTTEWRHGAVVVSVDAPIGCLWLTGPEREDTYLPNSCQMKRYTIPPSLHPLPGDTVTLVRDLHRDSVLIPWLQTYLPQVQR